jgi:hypothetical protein
MSKKKEPATPEAVKVMPTVKIVVRSPFMDRYDRKIKYERGDVLQFDEERARDVVERGLADYAEDNENINSNPNGDEDGQENE